LERQAIDPEAYLRSVFERIADHPINRIDGLPWNVRLPSSQTAALARLPEERYHTMTQAQQTDVAAHHLSAGPGRRPHQHRTDAAHRGAAIVVNEQMRIAGLAWREGEAFP
jgi:hypothetical protein